MDKNITISLDDLFTQFYRKRFSFLKGSENDEAISFPDHRYYGFLILALNPGVQFDSSNIAGHMPFPTTTGLVHRHWATRKGHFRSQKLNSFINVTTKQMGDHKRTLFSFEGMSTGQVKQLFSTYEKLPESLLFPDTEKRTLRFFGQYWDPSKRMNRRMSFTEDREADSIRDVIERYVYPIEFEYRNAEDIFQKYVDEHEMGGELPYMISDSIRSQSTYRIKKYTSSPRLLYVSNTFEKGFVDAARSVGTTLATSFDMFRFLHCGIPPVHGAPCLSEWNRLLSVKGVASYEILDILRSRHAKYGAGN